MVSSRMIDSVGYASQFGRFGCGRNNLGNASWNPQSVKSRISSILQRITKNSCIYYFIQCLFFTLFAEKSLSHVSGQTTLSFSYTGTDYDCNTNIFCRDGAHVYTYVPIHQVRSGMLALTYEDPLATKATGGLAFYTELVRLKDPISGKSASFNTSFTITQFSQFNLSGDGMTFVLRSNYSQPGLGGHFFGIFGDNNTNALQGFRTVAVEFDTFQNFEVEANDINGNHLSFDLLSNLTYAVAKDAAEAGVFLTDQNSTTHAWVEYSGSTNQLEARVSPNDTRPDIALLSYQVNLFDYVDEYMWVGFSSGNGGAKSTFCVGSWTFVSYGIPQSSPPTASPAPSVPRPSSPAPQKSSPAPPPPPPTPAPSVPRLSSPAPQKSRSAKLDLVLGTAVGIPFALLLACIVIFLVLVRRRADGERHWRLWRDPSSKVDSTTEILEGMPQRFSYKELSAATGNFCEKSKLGQGGFGSVYRGVLRSSGVEVAVKRINAGSTQGQKEFMAEVLIISQLRHRNLIQLSGWCMDACRNKFLIAYELMPNGSLDKVLFRSAVKKSIPCLSWSQRFKIVTGTAAALDYLHQGWKQQVIHRDVKSSNIMLDAEWNAKLGDFGLARLVDHQMAASTTMVAGTYGYIAPEAGFLRRFTDKTDVFAFGAVLLEVACGRKAVLYCAPEDEILLVDWVWTKFSENDLLSTVDKRLEGKYDTHWMEVVLMLGLLCSHPDPESRPSMRQVVQVLAGDAEVPSIPTFKPDFVWRSSRRVQSSPSSIFSSGVESSGTFECKSGPIPTAPMDISYRYLGNQQEDIYTV